MPVINRAIVLTTTPNLKPLLTIHPPRHSFSTIGPLSLDSQFYRSDFQSQGYTAPYEPGRPTEGPLSQASRHGAPRLTPSLLKEHLDKFVVGQDRAKKVTSVAIYNHYQRIREIRRQEAEDNEKREQKARWELKERERNSHPVENEYPGHVETVDLNPPSSGIPEFEPEPELGSKPLSLSSNPPTVIEKSNLLLLGPSGVGKTYILQTLARVLEVPFATVDCSSLTQAGYIGTDIESSIERLLLASSHSVSKCETGIIFFDEVDKLAKPAVMTHGRDVSGEGVQQGLLKMIEGTTVTVNAKSDKNSKTEQSSGSSRGSDRLDRGGREGGAGNQPQSGAGKSEQYTIDTSNILFVFAGAFVGLEKIIEKRLSSGTSLGFGAQIRYPPSPSPSSLSLSLSQNSKSGINKRKRDRPPKTALHHVTPTDLQTYGLIPELLGRIPITVPLSPLSLTQLVSILTEPKNSLVKQYTALFNTYGIQLRFTTASLHAVAERALGVSNSDGKDGGKGGKREGGGIGARGLRAILEGVLQEVMFWGPGSSIRFCLIDEAFVHSHSPSHPPPSTSSTTSATSASSSENNIAEREEDDDEEKSKMPRCWSRGQSRLFEEAYEKEELEWDAMINGSSPGTEEGDRDEASFETLRVGGSSGM